MVYFEYRTSYYEFKSNLLINYSSYLLDSKIKFNQNEINLNKIEKKNRDLNYKNGQPAREFYFSCK